MPVPLAGPGQGLPFPQNLYPSELLNAPYDPSSNRQALAPGNSIVLPAGDWYISLGQYCVLQYLDPVTGIWTMATAPGWTSGNLLITADGFTSRIANLTGCPVSASVTSYGSAYVQSTTSITVAGGTSTWLPIVGGQLAVLSITAAGAGYGVAPLVFIPPAPPAQTNANGVGGIQASAYAVIASGTVSAITFTNPGAGYPVAPIGLIVPSPFDPNLSTGITAATVTFSLVGSGSITGALCTNNGVALANPANVTLTVAGAGTNATIVPNVMQTILTCSTTGNGTGWGTVAAAITTVGGSASVGTITNSPEFNNIAFRPRPAQIQVTLTGAGTIAAQVGTIYDGGLFLNKPNAVLLPSQFAGGPTPGLGSIVGPTITFTMGGANDLVIIQPGT